MKSTLKKLTVLLGVALVAVALTGCTPKKAEPTATPVAVSTPVAVATETPKTEPVVETTVETTVEATATPAKVG